MTCSSRDETTSAPRIDRMKRFFLYILKLDFDLGLGLAVQSIDGVYSPKMLIK